MCQIFAGPSNHVRDMLLNTSGLLEALFDANPDGWGAMYHTNHGVKALKMLPRTVDDTREYVLALPNDGRNVAVHWRMRTSGAIDTHNAHPHRADGGYVIHNGILGDVDMSSNPALCDTIHFIRQYLDGSIHAIVASDKLQRMIGEFIDNNRFVIMSDTGDMCIINRAQGYEVNGVWVANTYASPPALLIPAYKVSRGGYEGRRGAYEGRSHLGSWNTHGYELGGAYEAEDDMDEADEYLSMAAEIECALDTFDADALADVIDCCPEAVSYILRAFHITAYHKYTSEGKEIDMAVDAWVAGQEDDLLLTDSYTAARALMAGCEWTARQYAVEAL